MIRYITDSFNTTYFLADDEKSIARYIYSILHYCHEWKDQFNEYYHVEYLKYKIREILRSYFGYDKANKFKFDLVKGHKGKYVMIPLNRLSKRLLEKYKNVRLIHKFEYIKFNSRRPFICKSSYERT